MKQPDTRITALPDRQELFIERAFAAPRELVFRAFSEPDLLLQFLGPRHLVMKIDRFEMHSGGHYRYTHTNEQGVEYGFHGSVHEVSPPERIIQTFEFEGMPARGHVSLDTLLFKPLPGGHTQLVIHSVFRSVADRDAAIRSGMETGINDGFARLDALLASGKISL